MSGMAKSAAARQAAAKAAEINAKLLAKGVPIKREVLLLKQGQQFQKVLPKQQRQMPVVYSAEIEINDIDNRGLILKSNIQDQIGQWTETTLVTRGRYIPKHRQSDIITKMERPLYIHISAVNKDWSCTEKAIHYVLAVLKQTAVPSGSRGFQCDKYPDPVLMKICERDIEESTVPFVERVYCDMGDQPLPWNIKQEIEGPNGSFIEHIVKSTRARIILRGSLSGYLEPETERELKEPLFIQINHSNLEGLVEAKRLVDSLLLTVHQKIREKRSTVSPQTYGFPTAQSSTTYPTSNSGVVYPSQQTAPTTYRPGQHSAPSYRAGHNHMSGSQIPDHRTPTWVTSYSDPASQQQGEMAGNQRQIMDHVLTLNNNNPSHNKDGNLGTSKPERVQSKRRFQENFNPSKKRKSKYDSLKMPPPPPPLPANTTSPISAGNVSDWIKETQKSNSSSDSSRTRGRSNFDKTLVCDYSDSEDDD